VAGSITIARKNQFHDYEAAVAHLALCGSDARSGSLFSYMDLEKPDTGRQETFVSVRRLMDEPGQSSRFVMPPARSRKPLLYAPRDRCQGGQGARRRSRSLPLPCHGRPLGESPVRSADRRRSPN
jgi:hypothetical protein